MEPQHITENKTSFLKNDRALVCSMFIVYGLCILGLIGAAFWGLDRRNKQISLNATSTAYAIATERVNATATAVAQTTEQAQYEIIDNFDDNSRLWMAGSIHDEYMDGSISVSTGLYVWNIHKVKQPFVYWSDFTNVNRVPDFDTYVDTKFVDGEPGNVCGGFVFRTASADWEDGAYTFSMCNDSYFEADYYKEGEWEDLSKRMFSRAITKDGWNRLELHARRDHFTFIINHEVVLQITDDRLKTGGLALLVEVDGSDSVSLWFDNFGYQHR